MSNPILNDMAYITRWVGTFRVPVYGPALAFFLAAMFISGALWADALPVVLHPDSRLDLRDFGAKGDGITDDSQALASAISSMMKRMPAPCIYASAGVYRIAATRLPLMSGAGCILGDGVRRTIFRIDPDYSGDVFSFSEAWLGDTVPFNGPAALLTHQSAGPLLRDFTISGDRRSLNEQNALVFYDRNDFVDIENVHVEYMKGRGLYSGAPKHSAAAYMRESRMANLRFFNTGSTDSPVVEWTSFGTDGATNEIDIMGMRIYAPHGTGMVFRNASSIPMQGFRIQQLSIEGTEGNPDQVSADLLTIGDANLAGKVGFLMFAQTEFLNSYAGYAAVRLVAPNPQSMPYDIDMHAVIGGGAGRGEGLVVEAGRALRFDFLNVATIGGYGITIGSAPLTAAPITFSGVDNMQDWSWRISPSAAGYVHVDVSSTNHRK